MLHTLAISRVVAGAWDVESLVLVSMGVDTGFKSWKLYCAMMESIYECWERWMVQHSWWHLILMPRSQWSSPRSVISTYLEI